MNESAANVVGTECRSALAWTHLMARSVIVMHKCTDS